MDAEQPSQSNLLVRPRETLPGDTAIWRYLPFKRFLDILRRHKFWFSRAFKFDDRWEGLYPPSYLRRTRQYAQAHGIPFEEFDQEFRQRLLRHRYGHFVNCWHISDRESDAMWKLYANAWKRDGKAKPGVAIQSTIGDVQECLRPHNSGSVIYYDPSHEVLSASIFGANDILLKRDFFAWEREYRFWFDDEKTFERIAAGNQVEETSLSPGRRVWITDIRFR